MIKIFILLTALCIAGCGGGSAEKGVSQYHMYGEKRVDCTKTKTTDESANVTQCPRIRPDAE